MTLVQMSFTAAVLILVVLFMRAITMNKLPKKTFLGLWGIVLLRLFLPFSLPFRFSVYTIANKEMQRNPNMGVVGNIMPLPKTAYTMQTFVQEPLHTAAISPLAIFWLMGLFACVVFFCIAYIRCFREFRLSSPAENEWVSQWLMEHKTMRNIRIRQSNRIHAPLTYGIFHPVILMPEDIDGENEAQLQYILMHEYIHIRRFDAVTKFLLIAAVCIHWFNPMVWVMYQIANRDIELSCDESVVRVFGLNKRSDYAYTLIHMEEKKSMIMPLCNNFSKQAIEERIKSIMKYKKSTFITIIAAVLLIVGITSIFATSAKTSEKTLDMGKQQKSLKNISIAVDIKQIYPGEFTEYGPYDLKKGDVVSCDLKRSNKEGNLVFSIAKAEDGYGKFSGLKTSPEVNIKENLKIKESASYYIYLSNRANSKNDLLDIQGNIYVPLAFTEEEMNLLLDLQFDGYENMSVSSFQEKIWKITDTQEYRNLLQNMYFDSGLESIRYTSEIASFLHQTLIPLTAEKWEEREFGNYVAAFDYKGENGAILESGNAAVLEYSMKRKILDANTLTVGEHARAIEGMMSGIEKFLRSKNAEELQNQKQIEEELNEEILNLKEKWEKNALTFDITYNYTPLESTYGEASAESSVEEERPRPAGEADYDSLLELKKPDYQKQTVKAFNLAVLEWANENFEKLEVIGADLAWEDIQINLTEEERAFVISVITFSGNENAEFVKSNYNGKPEEDPILYYPLMNKSYDGTYFASCGLSYWLTYHIADKNTLTVLERDEKLFGAVNAIQEFWDYTEIQELLTMDKNEVTKQLERIAKKYSNGDMTVKIKDVFYESQKEEKKL